MIVRILGEGQWDVSDDRLDALVWALTDLFLGQERRVAKAF